MPIKTAVAISYDDMRYYVLTGRLCHKNLLEEHDDVHIISITNVDNHKCPRLFKDDQPNTLQLSFDDTDVNNQDSVAWAKSVGWSNPLTLSQAEQLWFAIDNANRSDKSVLLLVNCMAGISRSGAIVEFARVKYGLDKYRFNELNPQIYPNKYVHELITYCSQRN